MSDILEAVRNGGAKVNIGSNYTPPKSNKVRCDNCGDYVDPSDIRTVQIEVATGRSGDSVTYVGDIFSFGKGGGKRGGVRYNTGKTYYKILHQRRCSKCRGSGSVLGGIIFIIVVVAAVYYFFKGDSNEQTKRLQEPSKQSSSTGLPVERRQEEFDQEKSLVAGGKQQQQVPGKEEVSRVTKEEDRIRAILENKIEE